jgi:hypothetical protein
MIPPVPNNLRKGTIPFDVNPELRLQNFPHVQNMINSNSVNPATNLQQKMPYITNINHMYIPRNTVQISPLNNMTQIYGHINSFNLFN